MLHLQDLVLGESLLNWQFGGAKTESDWLGYNFDVLILFRLHVVQVTLLSRLQDSQMLELWAGDDGARGRRKMIQQYAAEKSQDGKYCHATLGIQLKIGGLLSKKGPAMCFGGSAYFYLIACAINDWP